MSIMQGWFDVEFKLQKVRIRAHMLRLRWQRRRWSR